MNAHLNRAEKQLQAVSHVLKQLEAKDEATAGGNLLNEASAGLATAALSLRSADETISRETSMEKRQAYKQ